MQKSFADKIVSNRAAHILRIDAKEEETGDAACYFVMVQPMKERALQNAAVSGSFDIADYGVVIASCWGDAPDAETIALLKEKYNFTVH